MLNLCLYHSIKLVNQPKHLQAQNYNLHVDIIFAGFNAIVLLQKKIFSLLQIKKAEFADENFSVVVSKSANEVIATYTKDETGMDLVIRLPSSYPLRHVDVDCMRSLGISEVKQRKWLLSMMSFVRNQVIIVLFLY